jgi:hypothetical protein
MEIKIWMSVNIPVPVSYYAAFHVLLLTTSMPGEFTDVGFEFTFIYKHKK